MMEFREARPSDDPQLTQLVSTPLPGGLQLAFCREPSYLKACAECGPPRRVLVAADGEEILGLCSAFRRPFWCHSKVQNLWIVSDFRARPSAAGRGITGRGWTALRDILGGEPALISLLDENPRSRRLFSKPRPGWPRLHPIIDLQTHISPLLSWPDPPSLPEVSARAVSAQQASAFFQEEGAKEDLFPVIESTDFGTILGSSEHLLGVFEHDRLVGCAGLWDPSDHRQVKVHGYGGMFAQAHRWTRKLSPKMGLPEPGTNVPVSFVCPLLCQDPEHFRTLLAALRTEARRAGSQFLIWCRGGGGTSRWFDPFRFSYPSALYQLLWDDDAPFTGPLESRGFEVAWL